MIGDTYVDREFGTGALKITPAHDVNDYEIGKRHRLPMLTVMQKDGSMNQLAGKYAGLDRFKCRQQLWADMKEQGLVIREEKHSQRIPISQRSGEVIEPLLSKQWFLKMDGMAKRAVAAVEEKQLTIIPDRFEKVWFNWLTGIHDWCISRQLWWGHRLPVYYVRTSDGTPILTQGEEEAFVVARNEEEALRRAKEQYGEQVRVFQDEDVLDTWFR